MSPPEASRERPPASDWLLQGQVLEAEGSPLSLTKAVACYDQAIASLQEQPLANAEHALGIAHMNRGNALQKQAAPQGPILAVGAYDEAIAHLRAVARAGQPALINSLGAAWMNRGRALLQAGRAEEALQSQDEAIAVLRALPLDESPSYRINLGGACLNRAQTLLAPASADFTQARASAVAALAVTQPLEPDDALAAEIGLKARHTLCASLAPLLPTGKPGAASRFITETGDAIDEAMALIRRWDRRRPHAFRALAVSMYRFGAQFYLVHQPQFLAEFLLENLDPARAAGAMPADSELHAIAAETLARALADNYNHRLSQPNGPGAERLQEVTQALNAAEARRAELQRTHVPAS